MDSPTIVHASRVLLHGRASGFVIATDEIGIGKHAVLDRCSFRAPRLVVDADGPADIETVDCGVVEINGIARGSIVARQVVIGRRGRFLGEIRRIEDDAPAHALHAVVGFADDDEYLRFEAERVASALSGTRSRVREEDDDLAARLEATRARGTPLAVDRVCAENGLDETDRQILLLCAMPHLSPSFDRLFSRLDVLDDAGLTVGRLLAFFGAKGAERVALRDRFGPRSALIRAGLVAGPLGARFADDDVPLWVTSATVARLRGRQPHSATDLCDLMQTEVASLQSKFEGRTPEWHWNDLDASEVGDRAAHGALTVLVDRAPSRRRLPQEDFLIHVACALADSGQRVLVFHPRGRAAVFVRAAMAHEVNERDAPTSALRRLLEVVKCMSKWEMCFAPADNLAEACAEARRLSAPAQLDWLDRPPTTSGRPDAVVVFELDVGDEEWSGAFALASDLGVPVLTATRSAPAHIESLTFPVHGRGERLYARIAGQTCLSDLLEGS